MNNDESTINRVIGINIIITCIIIAITIIMETVRSFNELHFIPTVAISK